MLKNVVGVAVFAVAALTPVVSLAQEDEASLPYVYGIYYQCDMTRQELADEIVEAAFAGPYNAAVEAGQIQSWGWLAHHTGNEWRRLLYHSASDLDALFAALESTSEAVDEANPEMGRALGDICGSHVDYVWRYVVGSRAGDLPVDRADAAFSVYYNCKMSQQRRADEIVKDVFASVFNKHVGAGKLSSWGWMEHMIGGEYRRIWTMSGDDHSNVRAARDGIYTELMESHEDTLQEFHEICYSHQDMMWDIVIEKP
jgi:hypothetical protein